MKIFKLNYEYFTFISGAIMSIAISLMFEAVKNATFISCLLCSLSMLLMLGSSALCFALALRLKSIQTVYNSNFTIQKAISLSEHEAEKTAWDITIRKDGLLTHDSKILLILFITTVVTCIGSLALYFFSIIL